MVQRCAYSYYRKVWKKAALNILKCKLIWRAEDNEEIHHVHKLIIKNADCIIERNSEDTKQCIQNFKVSKIRNETYNSILNGVNVNELQNFLCQIYQISIPYWSVITYFSFPFVFSKTKINPGIVATCNDVNAMVE